MIRFASYPIGRAFTSIAMAALLLFPHAAVHAQETGQVVGFQDAQGKALFLHDFKGKPVLINLWATWCEPCVQEMPSLARLQQQYAAQGFTVIALSEDESLAPVREFYAKKGITNLPLYLDKGHGVWEALQARGVPTTVLVTRAGAMVQRIEGPVDWQSAPVQKIVNAVMEK